MFLTSFTFYLLFAVVVCVSLALRKHNGQRKSFLLIVSYLLYAAIDWRFPLILLFLTVINFIAGNIILSTKAKNHQKLALASVIVTSLAVLFYFKYFNFFIEQATILLGFNLVDREHYLLHVIMPVGISFMTFQAVTYPIDCYRKQISTRPSLSDFALFMAFFPQLLSGPIVRASYFIPQLSCVKGIDSGLFYDGFWQIVRGLIKKLIFADTLAYLIVDPAFASPSEFSSTFLVIAVVAFSIQIYMDLSGYTDIALGLGKMLGYKLPINFNRPYMATSIANYWQRWHISMSSFFRDYLYQLLDTWKWCSIYVKLILVFVAIGFWHGAGWNFLLYGFIHGSLVAVEHYFSERRTAKGLPPVLRRGGMLALQILQVFIIVAFTRILFRGDSVSSSIDFLTAIFSTTSQHTPITIVGVVLMIGALLLHVSPIRYRDNFSAMMTRVPILVSASLVTVAIYFMVMLSKDGAGFIYFQF